jgi:hypothetical protein
MDQSEVSISSNRRQSLERSELLFAEPRSRSVALYLHTHVQEEVSLPLRYTPLPKNIINPALEMFDFEL